jgi:hypothetical protein
MSTDLIKNEKKIVAGIVRAFDRMESAKKGYVYSVIELGEKLNEAKNLVPFGEWEKWLKVNSELTFGHEQATKFMKISNNKLLVLEYFNSEQSVNNLTKAISNATPEQLAKVEELRQAEIEARLAEINAAQQKKEEEESAAKEKFHDEIIDGEFTEVKKSEDKIDIHVDAPDKTEAHLEPVYSETQELHDLLNEQFSVNKSISDDNKSLVKIFEADDKLSQAVAELTQVKALNRMLNERINGLMSEANAAKKQAKYWQNKYQKLEKEHGAV